jgi:hypothetical protein
MFVIERSGLMVASSTSEKLYVLNQNQQRYNLNRDCIEKRVNTMSQTEITESLQTSTSFYKLFQTLPLEIRQGFLRILFHDNPSELEDFILYLAGENSRKEGFLSDLEAQSFLQSLPQ